MKYLKYSVIKKQKLLYLILMCTYYGKESYLYDTRVGDQAVFYGLLFDRIACLPAQWNMRRLPKKTIHMLESQELGNILDLQKYVI